jgi:hypothetical protein
MQLVSNSPDPANAHRFPHAAVFRCYFKLESMSFNNLVLIAFFARRTGAMSAGAAVVSGPAAVR